MGVSYRLWLRTFQELSTLCKDGRTEVRNCAIQTLFKTLTTHGPHMQHQIWPSVIHEARTRLLSDLINRFANILTDLNLPQILFPLLTDIRNGVAAANKSRIDTELGKEGGKSVIMYANMNNSGIVYLL